MPRKVNKPHNTENGTKLSTLVTNISGSLVGAMVGLVIGGPVGAAVGAASGPTTSFALEYLARRQRRALQTLELAAQLQNEGTETFVAALLASEDKVDLSAIILNMSASTNFDEKRAAYSQLLSEIRQEGGNLEKYFTFSRILDQLDPIHLAVLKYIDEHNPEGDNLSGRTPYEIILKFPDYESVLRSVVRVMELHGLLVDDARLKPLEHSGNVYWRTTELGRALLGVVDNT
ncbi:glycine zipper family protein [Kordiimonas aestuarii]|uniref:glycine zipper family protein n=1 Tax=Kordiimonas aestuarii TaxID=1005925 RepID=UPI0021D25BB9|nr:glycine zipper family protein [Kordiimonas aestuarii]